MYFSNTGRGYGSNFVTALRALKSTYNLYFGFPSAELSDTSMAGAAHGEELTLIIPASIFSTSAFIPPLSAKGVLYCGLLMGVVFSNSIRCSITSLSRKSLVFSSWKRLQTSTVRVLATVFPSWVSGLTSHLATFRRELHFSFFAMFCSHWLFV